MSKQELDIECQKFNSINTIESLTLNKFGILTGSIPANFGMEPDSNLVIEKISMIVTTFGDFMGIDKNVILSNLSNIEKEVF